MLVADLFIPFVPRHRTTPQDPKKDDALGGFEVGQSKPDEKVFNAFSGRTNNRLDAWGLRLALVALNYQPTDEDIKQHMIIRGVKKAEVDAGEFQLIVDAQRKKENGPKRLSELAEAFAAMGGRPDSKDSISGQALTTALKGDFPMTFKPDDFNQFKATEELPDTISYDLFVSMFEH